MLVKDLYTVEHIEADEKSIRATLVVNPSHDIFKGHFPELPVLPGVCMVQCIKELIENAFEVKSKMGQADMIKFLSMLNPVESNKMHAEIIIRDKTDLKIVFQATLKSGEQFLLKYSGNVLLAKVI